MAFFLKLKILKIGELKIRHFNEVYLENYKNNMTDCNMYTNVSSNNDFSFFFLLKKKNLTFTVIYFKSSMNDN